VAASRQYAKPSPPPKYSRLSAIGRELYTTGFVRLGADFDGDDEIEGATVCHALGDLFLARYELPE
jgi:hypothetical protein